MKILVLTIFAVFAVACNALLTEEQLQTEFTTWMQFHGKAYASDEFQYRYQVFKQNALFIEKFNTLNSTFRVAMNKFGDLTVDEFSKLYLGFQGNRAQMRAPSSAEFVPLLPTIPTSIDWRQKGAVTHVKNQGQCGSCWSFSTTGSCEGAHFLATGSLVSLSEQQLVDCSGSYGNQGCNGGLMDDAFQYIMANGGLESESQYPYTASDGTCQFNSNYVQATINGYHDVPSGNENSLTNSIGSISPVSVAIDASQSSFQFYSGGVYYEPACSSTQLDHGVLAVGYGTSSGADYYIVKNSWGTDWGMNGYIWMSRNRNNNCGIATAASYPCAQGENNCPATI